MTDPTEEPSEKGHPNALLLWAIKGLVGALIAVVGYAGGMANGSRTASPGLSRDDVVAIVVPIIKAACTEVASSINVDRVSMREKIVGDQNSQIAGVKSQLAVLENRLNDRDTRLSQMESKIDRIQVDVQTINVNIARLANTRP